MTKFARWALAGLVTVALFGLCAWIGGALVLPHLMRSSADRWAVAVGAAAVVSALAGTWAAAWAGRAESAEPATPARSVVIGRDNHGIVSTGDNARNTQSR
jgi:hypothetical protein